MVENHVRLKTHVGVVILFSIRNMLIILPLLLFYIILPLLLFYIISSLVSSDTQVYGP